jgi:hypothetical protein
MPIGALLCVISDPTQGRPWSAPAVRHTLHHLQATPTCAGGSHPTNSDTLVHLSAELGLPSGMIEDLVVPSAVREGVVPAVDWLGHEVV